MTTSSIGSSDFAGCGVFVQQHLRPRYRQFEAFAPHGLDQDAELQFAAAGNFHGILLVGFAHAQRHIAFRFAQQAVADHAAGDLVAFGAGERRVIDAEDHRQRRRIDWLRRKRRFHRWIADRHRHGCVRQSGNRDDVAGLRLVHRHALKPAECQHLGDAAGLDQLAIMIEHLHRLVGLHRT